MQSQRQQTAVSITQVTHQWVADIKQLFKLQHIHLFLIKQIQQILGHCQSIIVIYQKLFIKFKSQSKSEQNGLYMLKISRSFPLENSVRLYLLDGAYQPKIFDTRDLMREVLGKPWSYNIMLKEIIDSVPSFEEKMTKRNENYMALQKTGEFLLGDVFVYNQLQQHTSLTLFIDKTQQTTNILNAVSETHLLTFQRVVKKVYKSREEEEYQMKSKTLYGKKFMLSKFCDLQCIESMQVSTQTKEISLIIQKYRSLKTSNEYDMTTKKISFNDDESLRQFIRIVLKNLPKYQPTKISFVPCYDKSAMEMKDDMSIQRVIQLNQLQHRLQSRQSTGTKSPNDPTKRQDLVSRLNKSYQKMIEYYSARANPYYLIYVNKLNWLYNKHFVDTEQNEGKLVRRSSQGQKAKIGDHVSDGKNSIMDEGKDGKKLRKSQLAKSQTLNY